MSVVADSAPLISLAMVESLNLLPSLYERVHIPQAVYDEVVIIGRGRSGSEEVRVADWIERRTVSKLRIVRKLMAENLDVGESEAIILAQEMNAVLIVDDRNARRYAVEQGIPIIGAAGVLIQAKQIGLIAEVKKPLQQLLSAGFHMSELSVKKVLQKAGED